MMFEVEGYAGSFTLNMRQSHMNFITNEKVAWRQGNGGEMGILRSAEKGTQESTQRMINESSLPY